MYLFLFLFDVRDSRVSFRSQLDRLIHVTDWTFGDVDLIEKETSPHYIYSRIFTIYHSIIVICDSLYSKQRTTVIEISMFYYHTLKFWYESVQILSDQLSLYFSLTNGRRDNISELSIIKFLFIHQIKKI